MEHSAPGERIDDSIVESAEYNILPRPHELIASHIRTKMMKSKDIKEKPLPKDLKRKSLLKKSKEKDSREKNSKSKIVRKGNLKSASNSTRTSKDLKGSSRTKMLDSKFDSYVKKAMKSMHSYSSSQEVGSDSSEKSNKEQYLKEILNSAFTAQERYDVLNAKDNMIRLTSGKEDSEIKKISGTCPDMCPEKERYSRIAKNCLSILETKMALDPLTSSKDVDHRYMVKEYSRSSADQQEPLSHELRPVPVLKFTMDYLICNIINRQPSNISTADWFDFIWNRTRSIRKDITQQQLCDPESVDIIEKCVRFHIFCAEALSEEDTATFDPKINNENLTKCLQTLKHMYHDLQTRGIQCPNEAEFRAYDILLSLTEGETLRLVKDIQKNIVKSSYIKFAFEAALAFESNNYVKFFKLMEKGSYLNSCILHRYIHEARIRAVQVIIRSYSTPNYSMLYPLSNLVRDLKFENKLEAAEFCKWHGLTTDDEYVTIERQVFSKPSSAFPVARSAVLVSNKLTTGLGEIINSGKLPENPLLWYTPHDSFNSEGKLVEGNFTQETNEDNQEAMDQDEIIHPNGTFNQDKAINQNKFRNKNKAVDQDITPQEIPHNSVSDFPKQTQVNQVGFGLSQSHMREKILSKMISVEDANTGKSLPSNNLFSSVQQSSDGGNRKAFSYSASISKSNTRAKTSASSTFFSSQLSESKENSSNQFSFFHSSIGKKDSFKSVPGIHTNIVKQVQQETNTSIKSPVTISQGSASAFGESDHSFSKNFKWPSTKLENSKTPIAPSPATPKMQMSVSVKKSTELEKEVNQLSNMPENEIPLPQILALDEISESESSEQEIDIEEKIGEEDLSADVETLMKIRSETRNALVCDISDEVYTQCIEELSVDICEEIMADEVKRKQKNEENLMNLRHYLAVKTIYKWKLFCQRKKQRKLIENFEPLSPWIPMLINTEYVTSGATSPFTAYKKHCEVSRLADLKLKECRQKPGWESLETANFSLVMNYPSYPPVYLKNTGVNTFFKLGIIFVMYPNGDLSMFREWICSKFKLTSLPIKQNKEDLLSFYTLDGGKSLICIRGITMESSEDVITEFLHGVSAVILCCPNRFPDQEKFKTSLRWMSTIFDEQNLPCPFPLFTILLESSGKYDVINHLSSYLDERLQLGQDFSIIKMIKMSEVSNCAENSNELIKAVKWLIENQEQPPDIICYSIKDYLEDTFATAFDTLFWKLSLQEFKPLMEMPNQVITFYNKVIQTRAKLLNSESLDRIQQFWPPEELLMLKHDYKFIDKNLQEKFCKLMEELCLPYFDGDHSRTVDVWKYVNSVTTVHGVHRDILYYSIKNVLESGSDNNWLHIIGKCAYFAVCSYCSNFENILEKQIFVTKGDLEDVNFDRHWQNTLILMEHDQYAKKRKACDSELREVKKKRKNSLLFSPIMKDSDFSEEVADDPVVPISSSCKANNMLHTLKAAIKIQKEESDKFSQRLDDSISGIYHSEDSQLNVCKTNENLKNSSPESLSPKNDKHSNLRCSSDSSLCNYTKSSTNMCHTASSKESSDWRTIVGRASSEKYPTFSAVSENLDEVRCKVQMNKLIDNQSNFWDT